MPATLDTLQASIDSLREGLAARVHQHHVELYGLPADETCPGLKAQVADLTHSRRNLWWAMKAAWALCLAGLGFAASR